MSNGRASNLVSREPLSLREGLGRRGEDEGSPSAVLPQATAQPSPRSRRDSTTAIARNKYHLLKLHE